MLLTIILIIVVGAGAFYAGVKYQQSQKGSFNGRFGNFRIMGGNNGTGRLGLRPVSGQITAADDKSITVKLTDGSSKIVLLSSSTVYLKSSTGSKSDLKTGDRVAVFGNDNSDGSVTAQNIQINPPARGNFGR